MLQDPTEIRLSMYVDTNIIPHLTKQLAMEKSQCTSRGIPVCGARIKELRRRRGWTQQDLAHHSGYSDRLIRKAESGGTVSEETLEILAQALSDAHCQVTVEDLSLSTRASAIVLQDAILNSGSLEGLVGHMHPSISIDCSRVDRRLPLHGLFQRHSGLVDWHSSLSLLVDADRTTFSNKVLLDNSRFGYIHAEGEFLVRSNLAISFDLDLRFHFKECLVHEIVWLSSLEECAVLVSEWEQHVVSQYLSKLKTLYQANDDPVSA